MAAQHLRRGVLVTAALSACLIAPGSAVAGARGGARYDGRSAKGQPVFVQVSKDGRRLVRYAFATRQRCSDGKQHTVALTSESEAPAAVLPDASFHYTSKPRPGGTLEFKGRFDPIGNTVTGSLNAVSRRGRVLCRSGEVPFLLHRDGTPGAPYRDSRVASGLYTARGPRLRLHGRALLPGHLIHTFGVRYQLRCASGKTRRGADRITVIPLTRRGRFGIALRVGNRRLTHRFKVVGQFGYVKGGYRLAGAVRARDTIRRNGVVIDRCRTRLVLPFVGTFKRGPLGEEGPHPGH